ncbi:MAG: cyclic nucleotide-binding domain-containing protein [Acidimicrobiales bacterium]
MRVESSVTSVSWIPSEAIRGITKLPFELKVGHYDAAPPERIDPHDLAALRDADRFRFANHLSGWIEVEDGRIVDHGQGGGGVLNNTRMRVGPAGFTFQAHGFPDLTPAPEVGTSSAVFTQTAGGRPGMPAPRLVGRGRPALVAPTVWTTLRLELHADGRTDAAMVGATTFPRHWVYDARGHVAEKSATISFKDWYERGPGTKATPWGDEDNPVFTTMAETALERELSSTLMQHGRPDVRELDRGTELTRQGDTGDELFVILDGMVSVDVDGRDLGDLGPGAVVGERALLEGGRRTATVRTITPARVAVVAAAAVSQHALEQLRSQHRREGGDEPSVGSE